MLVTSWIFQPKSLRQVFCLFAESLPSSTPGQAQLYRSMGCYKGTSPFKPVGACAITLYFYALRAPAIRDLTKCGVFLLTGWSCFVSPYAIHPIYNVNCTASTTTKLVMTISVCNTGVSNPYLLSSVSVDSRRAEL